LKGKKKALIISISEYDDPEIQNLKFCEKDGQLMYEALKKADFEILKKNILIGKVEFNSVQKAIKNFFRGDDVQPDDTLLFYYSGHGAPWGKDEYYIITSDTDARKPDVNGFKFSNLTTLADDSISTKKISILDCCFSGGAKMAKGITDSQALVGKIIMNDQFAEEGDGSYLLASSLSTQQSFNSKEGDCSVFTKYIVQGLSGEEEEAVDEKGYVTPEKLGSYVFKKMRFLETPQKPIKKVEGSGEIYLAYYPNFKPRETDQFPSNDEIKKAMEVLEQELPKEKLEEFLRLLTKELEGEELSDKEEDRLWALQEQVNEIEELALKQKAGYREHQLREDWSPLNNGIKNSHTNEEVNKISLANNGNKKPLTRAQINKLAPSQDEINKAMEGLEREFPKEKLDEWVRILEKEENDEELSDKEENKWNALQERLTDIEWYALMLKSGIDEFELNKFWAEDLIEQSKSKDIDEIDKNEETITREVINLLVPSQKQVNKFLKNLDREFPKEKLDEWVRIAKKSQEDGIEKLSDKEEEKFQAIWGKISKDEIYALMTRVGIDEFKLKNWWVKNVFRESKSKDIDKIGGLEDQSDFEEKEVGQGTKELEKHTDANFIDPELVNILKLRLAKGEITREEYEEKKNILGAL